MGIPFNYNDFHGGFNSYNAYDDLADNEARDVLNVQGTVAGAIVKRPGFLTDSTLAHPLLSLFTPVAGIHIGYDDTAQSLLKVSGGVSTTIKSGLTAGKRWSWVRAPVVAAQGPNFGMNGFDTPQQFAEANGATVNWTNATGTVAVPNGKYSLVFENQVYVSGVAANPSRLYWSAIADPTNWDPASLTGAGFEDFDPNDGQAITGIGQVGPYVLVFKPTKTWVLVSAATATVRKLSDQVGCVYHRSIASGLEGAYFLGADRVYVTNGSRITPISDKITPTVASFTPQAACYHDAHYYLSGSIFGSQATLDYDARLTSWWKHSLAINEFTRIFNGIDETVYAANQNAALLSQGFLNGVFQDNGANFTWSWSGPWQSPTFYRRRRFPTPFFRKRLRQTRYDGLGQVDFSLCKDFNTTPALIASDIFANSTITKEARSYGQGVANAFSIVFSGTYPTQAQVNQYTLLISDRKDSMGSGY